MTRKSERELEREVEALDGSDEDTASEATPIVYEDRETGKWYDDPGSAGEEVDPETTDPIVVFSRRDPGEGWNSGKRGER